MSQQDDRVKNEEIVDDAPRMRSVAMLSHQSAAPTIGFPPRLGGGVQFGSSSAFGGLKTTTSEQKVAVSKTPVATPPTKPWKVATLRAIPPYYQLERTHVSIANEVSLVEVTDRVMEILRLESIAAVYNDEEAKVAAETKECVKFVLRLWSSNSNQIVVECQRTAGCGMTYYQVVKKVLKAARDGSKVQTKKKELPATIPSQIRKNAPRVPETHLNESIQDSVQLACDMLKSGRLDSQQLSFESLVQLSQAYKSQCFCARLILTNGILLPAILSLVVFSRLDHNGTDPINGSIEQECVAAMRRHALTVLANCFASFDEAAFKSVLMDSPALADQKFLQTLVFIVASASTKPHEAADACVCLNCLCQQSEHAKQRVADLDASTYLENAQLCRHAMLQDASVKLIEILN